ncbi:MAG: extracellular solute-binding protein [Candidatus Nanopelagicales bacterium]
MKRTPKMALSVIAVALVAAGCSSDSGDSSTSEQTIRVWTHVNKSFNKAYQALADEFMAANPGVTIDFESFDYDTYIQTLQTSLPAGTEADVLQMFGTWTCSYSDNLASMPDSVASVSDAESQFFPGPLGGYECDDKLFGLPQESNIEYGATLVNTAMAADAGVELDGWDSFDEFKADMKAMTVVENGEITRAGYHFTTNDGMAYSFLSLILQSGGQYFNDETFTFNSPEGQESLEMLKSIVDDGIVDPNTFGDVANWVGDCYFTELCAAGLVGPWVIPEYAEDFPEVTADTVYVPLPTLDNPEFVADSGWGLTVSSGSEVQDTAWDFVNFVAGDDANALQWNIDTGTLPAIKDNVQGDARDELLADAAYFEPFLDLLGNARYVGSLPDRDRLFYKIVSPHVLSALNGQETVDEALAAMESEANQL